MRLTKNDRKLLHALALNGRATYTELGKAAGIHRQSAAERIDRLEKAGIIKGYETSINFARLGLTHYETFFTFYDFTGTKREYLIDYFTKHPFVRWVGEAFMQPHLRVNFHAVSNEHFEEIIVDVEDSIGAEIKDFTFNTVLEHVKHMPGAHDPKDAHTAYELAEHERKRMKPFLDQHDVDILRELCLDARIKLVLLAERTGLSIETVRQRKAALEKKKVILKYTVNIDLEKVDERLWAIMHVRVTNKNNEIDKRIRSWLRMSNFVSNTHKMFGEYHYGISLVAHTIYELNDATTEFLSTFSNNIDNSRIMWMFRGYKYPKIGMGIFDVLMEEAQKDHGKKLYE